MAEAVSTTYDVVIIANQSEDEVYYVEKMKNFLANRNITSFCIPHDEEPGRSLFEFDEFNCRLVVTIFTANESPTKDKIYHINEEILYINLISVMNLSCPSRIFPICLNCKLSEIKEHSVFKNIGHESVQFEQNKRVNPDIFWKICERLKLLTQYDSVYPLETKTRGHMLIINNEIFINPADSREGSGKDCERLRREFSSLKYEIEVQNNLTAKDMKACLKAFAGKVNDQPRDSTVVAILSHGEKNQIYGVDANLIDIEDDVIAPFNNKNCPNMKGRPKLFIFQACRTERISTSSSLSSYGKLSISCKSDPKDSIIDIEIKMQEPQISDRQNYQVKSDIVEAYSTLPGDESDRDMEAGSWYIQTLCDVFRDRAADTHVLDMLTEINRKFEEYDRTQRPCVASTLTKKMYFKSQF